MFATIAGSRKDGKTRFWLSVSEKNDKGEYIDGQIPCRLSDKAKDLFLEKCEKTKNPDIAIVKADITEYWLKPYNYELDGKVQKKVLVFVNAFKVKEAKKSSW